MARACDPGEKAATGGGSLSTARWSLTWSPMVKRMVGWYLVPRYRGCAAMTISYRSTPLFTFKISIR